MVPARKTSISQWLQQKLFSSYHRSGADRTDGRLIAVQKECTRKIKNAKTWQESLSILYGMGRNWCIAGRYSMHRCHF